jgi:hypothetical protein
MKKHEISIDFPLTAHPIIQRYAEKFSQDEWMDLYKVKMSKLANLDDNELVQLVEELLETLKIPEVINGLEAGWGDIEYLVGDIQEQMIESAKREKNTSAIFDIETQQHCGSLYLLSMGLNIEVLRSLESMSSPEAMAELTTTMARILQSKTTREEKREMFKNYWTYSQGHIVNIFFKDFCQQNASASEFYDFIDTQFTYDQYKSLAKNSAIATFNLDGEIKNYEITKNNYKSMANFFIKAANLVEFVEALEVSIVNKGEKTEPLFQPGKISPISDYEQEVIETSAVEELDSSSEQKVSQSLAKNTSSFWSKNLCKVVGGAAAVASLGLSLYALTGSNNSEQSGPKF